MFQITVLILGCVCNALVAFCDSVENVQTETIGKLKYPVYTVGGETTGMALEVPRHRDYELEISDSILLAQAKTLDGYLVRVKGEIYTKPGIEGPSREIIRVSELRAPKKELQCEGSEYLSNFYEEGKLATVTQDRALLGVLNCVSENSSISCYEPNLVDAGYRLRSINDKTYRLFEVSFFGERQVDVLRCQ